MSKILKQLNDNQNKFADTNGIMKLQAWDDGVAQDLTNKNITATVANASGFLFDIDLVSNGTKIDLDFKDSQLQKLTPDTYFIEIKVTEADGDISVFPTEGYATFTINKNLHATEGALVPQITFDTVLADVKKAVDEKVANYTSTIAKGDKGDKGDPGKDAPIPIVGGRNLLLDTGRSFTGIGDGSTNGNFNSQSGQYYLAGGKKALDLYNQYGPSGYLTLSFDWVASGNTISGQFSPQWNNIPWGGNLDANLISISSTNTSGHYKAIASLSSNGYSAGIASGIRFRQDNLQGNVTISNMKLEAGNVATDWSPAPEDIDSRYIQKSGDIMTGNLTAPQVTATDVLTGFHNVIQVPGTTTKIIDLINNDFINGRGFWKEQTYMAYDNVLSDAPTNDNYSIIKLATRGSNRTYVEYSDLSGNVWHTTATTNLLNPWVKQADDSTVVHNTGNETVAGNKTLTGLTTMLIGNYGFRVTSSGFQKTTDGGTTWVRADL